MNYWSTLSIIWNLLIGVLYVKKNCHMKNSNQSKILAFCTWGNQKSIKSRLIGVTKTGCFCMARNVVLNIDLGRSFTALTLLLSPTHLATAAARATPSSSPLPLPPLCIMGLSKRWETMLFLFTGATIAYVLRVNMSVCAPKMHDELVSGVCD